MTKKRTWTDEEDDYIKNNYKKLSDEDLANTLKTSEVLISRRRSALGLTHRWTKEERDFIKQNYESMSDEEIGEVLGRTRGAVCGTRISLGIERKDYIFNKEEEHFIRINYKEMTDKEIGLKLGKNAYTIKRRRLAMGLNDKQQSPQISERFGRWTVLSKSEKVGQNGRAFYVCVCECQNKTVKDVPGASLRNGQSQSCGCYQIDRLKEVHRLPPGESSLNRFEETYKSSAGRRKPPIPYELPTDFFRELVSQNCYYCGMEPRFWNPVCDKNGVRYKNGSNSTSDEWVKQLGIYINGIDRINNDHNIGYVVDNVVPCCKICNIMKQALTEQEFIDHLIRICNFQISKGHIVNKDQCSPYLIRVFGV